MSSAVHIAAKVYSPTFEAGGGKYKAPHPSPPLEGEGTNL